ncbi:unnamed protein product [Mytilus coruscus]|uniref:SET domain-containing protein n=1 Tax=Mytilus coruscus TaxID=42192 RepID=A0A6J8EE71_MYTCO|nr:unnamed protein product [Mytilus coruscus]
MNWKSVTENKTVKRMTTVAVPCLRKSNASGKRSIQNKPEAEMSQADWLRDVQQLIKPDCSLHCKLYWPRNVDNTNIPVYVWQKSMIKYYQLNDLETGCLNLRQDGTTIFNLGPECHTSKKNDLLTVPEEVIGKKLKEYAINHLNEKLLRESLKTNHKKEKVTRDNLKCRRQDRRVGKKAEMLQTMLSLFNQGLCNDSDTSFGPITDSAKSVGENILGRYVQAPLLLLKVSFVYNLNDCSYGIILKFVDLRRLSRRVLKIEDFINSKTDREGFLVRVIDDIKGSMHLMTTNPKSLGRLVNDDENDSNSIVKRIIVDGLPHLCVFATKTISEGEEVTFTYFQGEYDQFPRRVKEGNTDEIRPVISLGFIQEGNTEEERQVKGNTEEEKTVVSNFYLLEQNDY